MNIQNAPLEKEQAKRIQTYIIDMGNIVACQRETKIQTLTLHSIMKRGWASIAHIEKLMAYCDKVENFNKTTKAA
jgi:hypothetical protein